MTASPLSEVSTQGSPDDGAPAPSGIFPRVICNRLMGVPHAEQTASISGLPPCRRLTSSTRRLVWRSYNPSDASAQPISCDGVPAIGGMSDSTELMSGVTGCTHFKAQRAGSTIDINLYYNRSFGPIVSATDGRWNGSYSTCLKPDFSIEEVVGGNVHWVHFDTKYRVAFSTTKTETGDPVIVRTCKSEDIDRMHTYRDAILGTRGCYVLYPGNTDKEIIFVRHAQEAYRNTWPGPSVGAFPLCPSNNANQDAQQARLESHLDQLIRAIEESAGYIEEEGFTSPLHKLA